MKLQRIHPTVLEGIWPLVDKYVREATSRSAGRYDVASIFNGIFDERFQLWVVLDTEKDNRVRACIVTQLLQYPTGLRAADIIIATGESRKEWIHLYPELEDWARDQDCGLFQMFARKGWAREFPSHKLSHVLLERAL